MRFDDMLATVLAQVAETPAARAALWRQLVDIAAQRRGADPELMAAAQARLRTLGAEMPEAVRAQTARSLGGRDLPPAVVALFGEQPASVAAPVLGTARMAEADWLAILPGLPPSGRALLRHRRDLPPGVVRALESFGPADFAIPGAVGVGIDHAPAEHAAEPAIDAPTEALVAEVPAEIDGATQIRTLVARIEAFRRRRPPLPRAEPESAPPGGFRFETDADGVFRWVRDIARGCLIGETIATSGEGLHGVDGAVAGAHRQRAPFRDARLGIAGTGADAGEWRISAVPFFASADGRFLGYRGTGRRPRADESATRTMPSAGLFGSGMAADSLRQLVHELRTPINAISGFAEMIERQMLGPAGDAYRSRATDIVRQAERLIDAIDDLDVAARIETQRLGLAREPVDLARLLAAAVAEHAALAVERSATIPLTMADDLPPAAGDRSALGRMTGRLIAAAVGLAGAGEAIPIGLAIEGERLCVTVARPAVLAGRDERALLDPGYGADGESPGAPALGLGFSLRLIGNLAAAAQGQLEIAPDAFVLRVPAAADAGLAEGRG